jgi:hypothetical protein
MGMHSSYGFVFSEREIWVLGVISLTEDRGEQLMFIVNRDLQSSIVIPIEYFPFVIRSVRIISKY